MIRAEIDIAYPVRPRKGERRAADGRLLSTMVVNEPWVGSYMHINGRERHLWVRTTATACHT